MKRIIKASTESKLGKWSKFYKIPTDKDFDDLGWDEEDRGVPESFEHYKELEPISWIIAKSPELEEILDAESIAYLAKDGSNIVAVLPYGERIYDVDFEELSDRLGI